MKKLAAVVLAALLLVSTATPVLAGCDPGRANVAGSYLYGSWMGVGVGTGTRFAGMSATLDNTAIPYREGNTATRQLLELENPSTGDKFYAGLRWSPGQGSLGSTQVMVLLDGSGGPGGGGSDDVWYSDPVSQLTSSYSHITITMLKEDFGPDELESYTVWIDGDPDYSVVTAYGPQGFTRAKVFSHTANLGSQVPGGSNDGQLANGITYTTQHGTASWAGSNPLQTNGNGVVTKGIGWLSTRDVACSTP